MGAGGTYLKLAHMTKPRGTEYPESLPYVKESEVEKLKGAWLCCDDTDTAVVVAAWWLMSCMWSAPCVGWIDVPDDRAKVREMLKPWLCGDFCNG